MMLNFKSILFLAILICVLCLSDSALLASPWTEEFSRAVTSLQTAEESSDDEEILPIYSGVHVVVLFADGGYNYVNGEPELERCGVWYPNGSTGEVSCKKRLPYACYLPVSAQASTTPTPSTAASIPPICGEQSLGYELSNQTGRCHKFHAQAASWPAANRTCVGEGGALVVPRSREDTRLLAALLATHPEGEIHGTWEKDYVAVGIYWDAEAGVWMTVDGQTLEQMGYAEWRPDKPFKSDTYPYAFLRRDGLLDNHTSNVKAAFICEKAAQARR